MRRERRRIAMLLRTETVGGVLLVLAAVIALVLANSPLDAGYRWLRDLRIGPEALGLQLSVQQWTADGLLAIFFFLAGLELKREFAAGELRDPRRAAVPVVAAVGGMVVPAALYLLITAGDPTAATGWAIPTATDIAFALAVLAVVGRHLPAALRTFLLTLAVVDDLLAIIVIALFYTQELHPTFLLLSLVPLAGFAVLVQRRVAPWWLLVPLALLGWALMHESGVHATVAGVVMGFAVPVLPRRGQRRAPGTPAAGGDGEDGDGGSAEGPDALAERLDHRLRPISAGLAVPLFAFFAAGVTIGGPSGLAAALTTRVVLAIVIGMVVGKAVGILVATLVTTRLTGSTLLRELGIPDVVGLAILGGVGFTVSLLIGDLAFGAGGERAEHVQIAVLTGSLAATALAAVVLGIRSRQYRRAAVR
jgi:NhaA family Na+:H+ antiporter